MVITGLTRNQFVLTDTWVRIPFPPPKALKTLGFQGFSFYSNPVKRTYNPCKKKPKKALNLQTFAQMQENQGAENPWLNSDKERIKLVTVS